MITTGAGKGINTFQDLIDKQTKSVLNVGRDMGWKFVATATCPTKPWHSRMLAVFTPNMGAATLKFPGKISMLFFIEIPFYYSCVPRGDWIFAGFAARARVGVEDTGNIVVNHFRLWLGE